MPDRNNLGKVAWPSWSKASDLRFLDSRWEQSRASSNLAATIVFDELPR